MNDLVIALTLFFNAPGLVPVDGLQPRSFLELRTYDSKTECEITARALKVDAPGGRLVCVRRELSPDEKRALLLAMRPM